MATKTKSRAATVALPEADPLVDVWRTPPANTEDRLQRIQALGQRINGYIRFMSGVNSLSGTSAEAKEKAVAVFYDRMVLLEQELARIQENLQLG
jgi:hypothetical protein